MRFVLALLSVIALPFAAPAAANPPTEEPIFEVFQDVNPCTGTPLTVTFVGTVSFHEHGSRIVAHAHRTITTSDGFAGHGTDSFVSNGQIDRFRMADIMKSPSGALFLVRSVFVFDLSNGTVRVEKDFGLICIHR